MDSGPGVARPSLERGARLRGGLFRLAALRTSWRWARGMPIEWRLRAAEEAEGPVAGLWRHRSTYLEPV